jgi:uncharacterized protein YlbG (UPF0298 family)
MITGDLDFVPVIKTARRGGVFVYLFTLGHNVKKELREVEMRVLVQKDSPFVLLYCRHCGILLSVADCRSGF